MRIKNGPAAAAIRNATATWPWAPWAYDTTPLAA